MPRGTRRLIRDREPFTQVAYTQGFKVLVPHSRFRPLPRTGSRRESGTGRVGKFDTHHRIPPARVTALVAAVVFVATDHSVQLAVTHLLFIVR